MTATNLILAAEDEEDLQVISARLQDAVAKVQDLVWLPRAGRFAALFNRFKWEEAERKNGKGDNVRVRAGLYFDRVRSVKSAKITRANPDAVVALLAIRFTAAGDDDPAGVVELIFAGGGTIRMDVECIDAGLSDVSGEWAALRRPLHDTDL